MSQAAPVMPLRFRDRRLGVLYVYRDDRDDFLPDDVSLLRTFAHLAAGVLCNARLHAEIVSLARIDGLTALHNRRSFDERLDIEVKRVDRYRGRFALQMLDLDHLKRVNDTYGHGAGDAVLKFVGGLLLRHTRAGVDLAARFGGEEFIMLLSEMDARGALVVAERIRGELEATAIRISDETEIRVTASIGVCCYPDGANTAGMLIRNADAALYAAKQGGRNRALAFGT